MYNFWRDSFLEFRRPVIQIPITTIGMVEVLLNLLLIIVIIFKRTQLVGIYKYLLFIYTFIGFLTTTIVILILPMMIASRNGAYLISTVVRFPHYLTKILMSLYVLCLNCWIIVLAYSFLYRCLAVRNRENLVFNRLGIGLMLIVAIFGCSFPTIFLWICSNPSITEETSIVLSELSGHNVSDLTVLGSEYFTAEGEIGDGALASSVVLGAMIPFVIMMIVSSAVYYSWYHRKRAQRSVTKETMRKHHRMFILLLFQSLIPLLFTLLPPIVVYVCALLSVRLPKEFNYAASGMLFLGHTVDPIWIFYFIRDYRETLCYCCIRKRTPDRTRIRFTSI